MMRIIFDKMIDNYRFEACLKCLQTGSKCILNNNFCDMVKYGDI